MLTFCDTDPNTPHKWMALSLSSDMVTLVTMAINSSFVMEMPAERQRTKNPAMPTI